MVRVSLGFLGVVFRGSAKADPLLPQVIQVSFQYLVKSKAQHAKSMQD